MDCDICGATGAWRRCKTEGTVLTTCDRCVSLGEEVHEKNTVSESPIEIMDIHPNYATRIKQAREGRRLSIYDLSKILGQSENIVKRIERGDMIPPIKLANKMEQELGIEILCKYEKSNIVTKQTQKITVGDVATVI